MKKTLFILSFFLLFLNSCEVLPIAPKIDFEYYIKTEGTVNFRNFSERASSYSWDFGDFQSSIEENPTHVYKKNGTYTVTFKVKNDHGEKVSTKTLTIADALKPVANFTISYDINGIVNFTNTSTNADSYLWTFGDGTTTTAKNVQKQYSKNGNYSVTLTAKNANGESTSAKSILVNSLATTGNIIFFTNYDAGIIDVYINNNLQGSITKFITSNTAPSCGLQGFVTITYPEGAYNMTAKSRSLFGGSWSSVINVKNGECKAFQLIK